MKIFMQTDDENVVWEQECFLLFTLDGFAIDANLSRSFRPFLS